MYWLYEATQTAILEAATMIIKKPPTIMKGMKNGTHTSRLYKPKTNSKYFK